LTGLRLITGATGLLGRHVARRLIDRQLPIRVLIRPTSDRQVIEGMITATSSETGSVQTPSIEYVVGDLADRNTLNDLLEGVSHVYHCAARLGDWGPWNAFESGVVSTTRNLVDRCVNANVLRMVHVSSVAAYGHIKSPKPWTETQPLGQNLWWWDYYAKAKLLAEDEARRLGEATTIVRPTWIYGPGDQTILPRILKTLRQGRVSILGRGDNQLNLVHARDVAKGVVLAGELDQAAGETFNLCSDGEITQKDFFDLLADEIGCQRVTNCVPFPVAHWFGFISECVARTRRQSTPPRVTRHGLSLLTRPVCFSSTAARETLGWTQNEPIRAGLIEAIKYAKELEAESGTSC